MRHLRVLFIVAVVAHSTGCVSVLQGSIGERLQVPEPTGAGARQGSQDVETSVHTIGVRTTGHHVEFQVLQFSLLANLLYLLTLGWAPSTFGGFATWSPAWADKLPDRLGETCASGQLTGLGSARSSASYLVLSDERVDIKGICVDAR